MLRILLLLLFISLFIELKAQESDLQNQIKTFTLDTHRVYEVYIKKGTGVTTFVFPSGIDKIAGNNVRTQIKYDVNGNLVSDFLLKSKDGSYYFNITALKDRAVGSINITYARNNYVIKLLHSPKKAYSSVSFIDYKSSAPRIIKAPSTARKISMLDIAKGYQMFKQHHPMVINDVEYFKPAVAKQFIFKKFTIFLEEVFRFNSDDTVVFKIILQNKTSEEIKYDRFSFVAQDKNIKYFQSISDSSGVMPPKTNSYAYFSITGSMRGGVPNLLPANSNWIILLTAKYMLASR